MLIEFLAMPRAGDIGDGDSDSYVWVKEPPPVSVWTQDESSGR